MLLVIITANAADDIERVSAVLGKGLRTGDIASGEWPADSGHRSNGDAVMAALEVVSDKEALMEAVNVAVVGVGAVGEVMLEILSLKEFSGRYSFLASARSAGKTVQFRGKRHAVQDLSEFDFSQTPIALFSAGVTSAEFAPIAATAETYL